MPYKTIILELLESQPNLYKHLRLSRKLLAELDRLATELRQEHQRWIGLGTGTSEARELAVEELERRIRQEAERYEE